MVLVFDDANLWKPGSSRLETDSTPTYRDFVFCALLQILTQHTHASWRQLELSSGDNYTKFVAAFVAAVVRCVRVLQQSKGNGTAQSRAFLGSERRRVRPVYMLSLIHI